MRCRARPHRRGCRLHVYAAWPPSYGCIRPVRGHASSVQPAQRTRRGTMRGWHRLRLRKPPILRRSLPYTPCLTSLSIGCLSRSAASYDLSSDRRAEWQCLPSEKSSGKQMLCARLWVARWRVLVGLPCRLCLWKIDHPADIHRCELPLDLYPSNQPNMLWIFPRLYCIRKNGGKCRNLFQLVQCVL